MTVHLGTLKTSNMYSSLSNESTVKHKETYTAHITLAYTDGLKANAYIEEFYFQDTYFELTDNDSEVISFKELDINGE